MSGFPLWFKLYSKLVESHIYKDVTFDDVQRVLGLSTSHAKQVIRRLLKLRLVVNRSDPTDKRFTFYRVVPLALWSKYWEMKDELAKPLWDILPLLFSIEDVHGILLLGSYVRRDFGEKSDIDVLVVSDNPERVLDLTYHTCLNLPIDLHACTPNEFKNSLYLLVQHVILYDDGTCKETDVFQVDVIKLLHDAVEGAQKVLNLYKDGLVQFDRIFPAIYESILVDAIFHGSTNELKTKVLEKFLAEHASVRNLRGDLFRLMAAYEKLTKGRGGEVGRLSREKEVEIYGKILSEVSKHV